MEIPLEALLLSGALFAFFFAKGSPFTCQQPSKDALLLCHGHWASETDTGAPFLSPWLRNLPSAESTESAESCAKAEASLSGPSAPAMSQASMDEHGADVTGKRAH